MTTHIREEAIQLVATEDLSGAKYKAITFAGTIAQAADRPARAAGICRFVCASGGHTGAIYEGITKAFVGGAVTTPGWPLMVANSGFLIAATSGGVALARMAQSTAAASGDLAMVMMMQPTLFTLA